MFKPFLALAFSALLLSSTTTAAQALEILVQNDGSVLFYQPQVLGESTESFSGESKEKENETKESYFMDPVQIEKRELERKKEQARPVKKIPSASDDRIRLKPKQEKTEVMIERKTENSEGDAQKIRPVFETNESLETDAVKIELPSGEHEREDSIDGTNSSDRNVDRTARQKIKIEEITRERKERRDEKISIQTEKHEDGQTEFQFESRDVKAKIRGSEIVVDPETNSVTVVAPNGETHELIHLPDQAMAQLLEHSSSEGVNSLAAEEIEIVTKEDGTVAYTVRQEKRKRLFGLFERTIETEVELDDSTGEITETDAEAESPLVRLLNSWSR